MDTSIELLIALAIALLLVGSILLFFWPMLPMAKLKASQQPSVTLSGEKGIITVRNAAGGDVKVFFGASATEGNDRIVPLQEASDEEAEKEVTILDELRSPDTAPERKAAIETELLALGYRIVSKRKPARSSARKPVGTPVAEDGERQKAPSEKPSVREAPNDNNNQESGSDEGLGEQEPVFESFHFQSE